jgi:putative oxygen-independent coproporphyrinogen III oxidase
MPRRVLGVSARREGVYVMVHDRPSTVRTTQSTSSAALYIHWPFCKKKCPYCDFNSHVREGVDHAAWRAAMLRELGYWHARAPEKSISSIFFGGGTPSLMETATVAALIEEADTLWGLDAACEITLEANPTSVEAAKFVDLAAAGVNRVSLGVQSLDPESLKFLGREHSASEALDAVALAAKIFPRYSFDLIYALPNQTLAGWEKELRAALTYARGHLSLYQLTIEENTAFHHAYHVGKSFALPEESLAADMYQLTQKIMDDAGLPAYEISNHASAGNASRHNLSYWQSDSYIGIGPGAHGRVDIATNRIATRNLKSPERWLDGAQQMGHGLEEELTLTIQERAEEIILMGLRLPHIGVDLAGLRADVASYLSNLWSDGRVDRLVEQGMLIASPTHLHATPRGQLVLNRVIEELLG